MVHGRDARAARGGEEGVHSPLCPHTGREVVQILWCSSGPHLLGLELPTAPHFCSLAGGGVMGAAGRNAAQVALEDFRCL